MKDTLPSIMQKLAEASGLPDLGPERDGTYILVFDRRWVVNIASDPATGRIHLLASALLRPGARPGPIASFPCPASQWIGLPGGVPGMETRVGMHRASGLLLLDASADPDALDAVDFRLWLQSFVDRVEQWAGILGGAGPVQEEDPFAPLPLASSSASAAPSAAWPACP